MKKKLIINIVEKRDYNTLKQKKLELELKLIWIKLNDLFGF